MESNLLHVPFRHTERLDIASRLRNVIKDDFFQSPYNFESDLLQIGKLRNKITSLDDDDVEERQEEEIKQYLAQVSSLARKFRDDCIDFDWYGTLGYKPKGPIKVQSLKLESLNVLYQLGSLFTQLPKKCSRYSEDGIKKACAYYQKAAGVFDLILAKITDKDHIQQFELNTSDDFEFNTISCLRWLSMAQAQEIFWQKAITNSKMSDSVISKLAYSCFVYYDSAVKFAKESPHIRQEWINNLDVKKYHFEGVAYYRASIKCQDNFQYGDQVAYLRKAKKAANNAWKSTRYVNEVVVKDLEGLRECIDNVLRTAEKENDLVYLKPVPEENDLPPTTPVSMIQIEEPDLTPTTGNRILFKGLLPFDVIQAAQAFKERQHIYVTEKISEPIEALKNMMNKFLIERNLPASIDSIQRTENLPKSIIDHAQEITRIGGIDFIESSMDEITSLVHESRNIFKGCEERLKIEEDEDVLLRRTLGASIWSRPSSQDAGAELRAKIEKMSIYLDQARQGDGIVLQNYQEIKPYVELYCSGFENLNSAIPNSSFEELDTEVYDVVLSLRKLLSRVTQLEEKGNKIVESCEFRSRDTNILSEVIAKYKELKDSIYDEHGDFDSSKLEPVFEKHVSTFDNELEQLERIKGSYIQTENEIDNLNNKFLSLYVKDHDFPHERRESLHQLEQVYSSYLDLISNLNEGSKFYISFIEKANNVLNECDEFILRRRLEGRDLEEKIRFSEIRSDAHGREMSHTSSTGHQGATWNPSKGINFD